MLEIDLFYSTFVVLYAIIFGITAIIYKFGYKNKKIRLSFIGIFEAYILMIIKVVILPIRIFTDANLRDSMQQSITFDNLVQLIPFHSISEFVDGRAYLQIGGNILLLMPLPIFLFYLLKKNTGKAILLSSIFFTIGIECIQLIISWSTSFPSRIFDVDDIILNFFGAVIGYGCCVILKRTSKCNEIIRENFILK